MKTLSRVLIAVCLLVSTQTLVAQQCINLKAQNANCTCKKNGVNDIGEGKWSMYYRQWHLTGYGEDSGNCAYNTYHLKVEDVWDTYKGEGIYIAIVEPDIIPTTNNLHIPFKDRSVLHKDLIENLS